MADVSTAAEYSIVRGGSGATGPQLSALFGAGTYSTCYDFCKSAIYNGMDVAGASKPVVWASCSTNENGNSESFTESTSSGHTDASVKRYQFWCIDVYSAQCTTPGYLIAECQSIP